MSCELDNDDVLWLWKDGNGLLAFRHLYPCYSPGGDPMTLGEPCGKAVFRHSHDRSATPQAQPQTVKESFTVGEQSAELDAGMAAQHYCRGLWGAARGHSDWRKVHEHFANGYKQGRYDELQALGPTPQAQPAENPWKDAVLDRLASASIDAPTDEFPSRILDRIIEVEVMISKELQPAPAAPAVPAVQPLTDGQIKDICKQLPYLPHATVFARAIEQAHGIGGPRND